jgi:hypothetical protein
MSSFQVSTEGLMIGSLLLGSSGDDVASAHARVSGSSGALAGTPAAGGYDAFVGSVTSTLASFTRVSSVLGAALSQAADAYQMADASAAGCLSPKRG